MVSKERCQLSRKWFA